MDGRRHCQLSLRDFGTWGYPADGMSTSQLNFLFLYGERLHISSNNSSVIYNKS
jgi:hypothetical protein